MSSRTASRVATAAILTIALSAATASTAGAVTILTLTPTSSNFGSVTVGDNSAPQSFKLTIDCDVFPFPFCVETFNPAPTSTSPEFPLLNLCPATIDQAHLPFPADDDPSCYIVGYFVPTGAGAKTATFSTGPGGPSATVTGTGVAAPAAPAVQAQGKCKKGGKKKGRAAKKCKRKKRK